MKHKQVSTDTITYSAVISACEKAGGKRGMINALKTLVSISKLDNPIEGAAAIQSALGKILRQST